MNTKHFGFTFATFAALAISLVTYWSYFNIGGNVSPYHDTLTYSFPYRFLMSNAMRSGVFPLWDHWSSGGMSLSSGIGILPSVFSPIVVFLSVFGIYSVGTLIVEMLVVQSICFIGMLFWLKEHVSKLVALYGALAFSLSAPILGTLSNYESLVVMSFLPTLFFALGKVLSGSVRYIGIFALVLMMVFSTGYVGLLLMYVPLVFAFSFLHLGKMRLKGVLFLFAAVILFLGLTNFQLLETWQYNAFNYAQFRKEGFDPFTGAGSVDQLYTLVFPNIKPLYSTYYDEQRPPFIPLQHLLPSPGVTGTVYFGILGLVFLPLAFLRKEKRKLSLLLISFALLSFVLSLSDQYEFVKGLSDMFLFLKLVRWHGWYATPFIFFAITLSCVGMDIYLQKMDKKYHTYVALGSLTLMLAVLFITVRYIGLRTYIFIPQIFVLGVTAFLAGILRRRSYVSLLIVGIAAVEIVFFSQGYITYRDGWGNARVFADLVATYKRFSSSGFPLTENARYPATYNLQIMARAPSYEGSFLIEDPKVLRLRKQLRKEQFVALMEKIFYVSGEDGKPLENSKSSITIKKIYPNEVEAFIDSSEGEETVVWSSPFTPSWKLYIDGALYPTRENVYGLTSFTVSKGAHQLIFRYQPWYFPISLAGMVVSYGFVAFLIVRGKLV